EESGGGLVREAGTHAGVLQTGDHGHVTPVVLEDIEVGRRRVVLAGVLRDEVVGMQTERCADADHASWRCRCLTRDGKLVEPRQCERNACGAKESSAWNLHGGAICSETSGFGRSRELTNGSRSSCC